MRAIDIIRVKRDGGELSSDALDAFVRGALPGGDWAPYQLAAMLMAIFVRGMSPAETATLTRAMADSGRRLDLRDLGPTADKHSTGGVGDKTSLVVAPLAAACGVVVPMVSGRGLGHSGGTLDKLEAVPGFRTDLSELEFRNCLRQAGLGMIGPTRDIAPADKTLYALRDATATVESLPLITASILSKKLAEGTATLVMDVKCGRGAFSKTRAEARALAESLVAVGRANGLPVRALVTAMDAPLGRGVGNALEVSEAIDVLQNDGNVPADLRELCVLLATRMVELAGVAGDADEARRRVLAALSSGAARERFQQCIELQGGDPRIVDDPSRLPRAPHVHRIDAKRSGYVAALDAERVGIAAMRLGAGRNRAEDAIDPAVGIVVRARPGECVRDGEPVLELHYRDETKLASALKALRSAWTIADGAPAASPLVLEELA